MGDLIFPDFQSKDRRYTKGGGIDDMKFLLVEDTAPCEMPPVWPDFHASDCASNNAPALPVGVCDCHTSTGDSQ